MAKKDRLIPVKPDQRVGEVGEFFSLHNEHPEWRPMGKKLLDLGISDAEIAYNLFRSQELIDPKMTLVEYRSIHGLILEAGRKVQE
jgi:hypothetical protein